MNIKTTMSHLDEETLELYVLRSLPESKVGAVEEHILVCSPCQEALAETEDFISAVKTATERLRYEQPETFKQTWRRYFSMPKPVWVSACAAALALVVMVPMLRDNNSSVQAVALSVTRGEIAAPANAKPGRVQIKVDATGIEAKSGYTVQVVDANNNPVLEASATRTGDSVAPASPVDLRAGQYWVRLFDANAKAEPLREYSLLVR